MRERVLPILEEYGTDLVLSGHSHNYERTYLLDGHYGASWTLQESMVLDRSSGGFDGTPPYRKPAGGIGSHRGTVYTVCGCSGAGGLDEGFRKHPAMAVNHGGFGSMIIEINDLQLRARFLRPSMAIDDEFIIDKSAPAVIRPQLDIARSSTGAQVSWPTSKPAFDLQWTDEAATNWANAPHIVRTNGRRNVVEVETNAATRFFRLHASP